MPLFKRAKYLVSVITIVFNLVIVAIPALTPATANAQSFQALFEKGFQLYKARDFETAEKFLKRGIDQDSENALGRYYLAEVMSVLGRPKSEVLLHYRAVTRLSPESQNGLDALAKATRIEAEQLEVARMRQPIIADFSKAAKKGSAGSSDSFNDQAYLACAWLLPKSKFTYDPRSLDIVSVEIYIGVITGRGSDRYGFSAKSNLTNKQYSEYTSKTAKWYDDYSQPSLTFKDFTYVSGQKIDSLLLNAEFVHFRKDRKTVFWIRFDHKKTPYRYSSGGPESGGCAI